VPGKRIERYGTSARAASNKAAAACAETLFREALDRFWSSFGCYLVLKQNFQLLFPISNPKMINVKTNEKFIKEAQLFCHVASPNVREPRKKQTNCTIRDRRARRPSGAYE
jgi:hypothetical protein